MCGYFAVQPNSKTGQCVGNKIVSIFVGFLQFVLYGAALIQVIFKPASLKTEANTGSIVGAALTLAVFLAFCVLLVVGIFQGNERYMNMYLIANVVMTSLFIIGFFTVLFTTPKQFGISGFIYSLIAIFQNLLFYFVIRNYVLALHRKRNQQIRGPV